MCYIFYSTNKEFRMTLALATQAEDDFSKKLKELDLIQDTCKKLLQTKHYQNLGEAGIHAIIARSKSLGIHPFEALNGGFHCINGKVGMSTEMMAALVRQRGHSIIKDPKSTNECVILHGKRADTGDTWTCSFSKEDAIAAGLWTTATWKKYPGIMLYNRCMSMLFRQLFPDLSLGAGYVEDELKEITKTGDYSLNHSFDPAQLPLAESEVQPKKEEKKREIKDKTPISEEQVKCLNYFFQGYDAYKETIMKALDKKYDIKSIETIPVEIYDELLKVVKDNFNKEETKKLENINPVDF